MYCNEIESVQYMQLSLPLLHPLSLRIPNGILPFRLKKHESVVVC